MPNRSTPTDGAAAWGGSWTRRNAVRLVGMALFGLVALAATPSGVRAADPSASPSPAPSVEPSIPPSPTPPPSTPPSPTPPPSPAPSPTPPPAPPVAVIGAIPSAPLTTLPATFADASTGSITSRTWTFGDGGQAATTATSISHTYAAAGTFTVTLTVVGPGGSASATGQVTVATAYRLDLYRRTAYVRQFTSTWCVGAAAQMMTNLARRASNRSWTNQSALMRYARSHDSLAWWRAGSDPRGWAMTLRRAGAGATYWFRQFPTRQAAIEYAARRIQLTHKPVGILAWSGAHAWVMTGFVASANPSTTGAQVVAAVIVSGPLGSPKDPIDRVMTIPAFARWFGPYGQRDGWRGWVGRYVVVAP